MSLVEVSHLVKTFTRAAGLFPTGTRVAAVADNSFTIAEGETLGLVGESGSGKTTAGRCLLRLIEPSAGSIRFEGEELTALDKHALRLRRRDLQIVFRDPQASLDPRIPVGSAIAEP